MNQVQLLGRLAADPAIRYTSSQIPVASFNLAVPRRKQKDKEKEVDFIPIVAWRQRAEFAQKYLRKGMRVAVTGEIQVRTYEDKSGNKRWATEIIATDIYFADGKADGTTGANSQYAQNNNTYSDDSYFDSDYEDNK